MRASDMWPEPESDDEITLPGVGNPLNGPAYEVWDEEPMYGPWGKDGYDEEDDTPTIPHIRTSYPEDLIPRPEDE